MQLLNNVAKQLRTNDRQLHNITRQLQYGGRQPSIKIRQLHNIGRQFECNNRQLNYNQKYFAATEACDRSKTVTRTRGHFLV
jgi:hypothetical protein